jgi:hypothetical protein
VNRLRVFEYLSTKHFPSIADLFSTEKKLFERLVRPVVQNCDQSVHYSRLYKAFLSEGIDISPVHPSAGKTHLPVSFGMPPNGWLAWVLTTKLNIAVRRGNTAAHYFAATLAL